MATMMESRVLQQRIAEWSVVSDDDPGLRALYSSARQLIADLEGGAEDAALCRSIPAYVDCAVAVGISRVRIMEALELLVHDHARAAGEALPKPCAGRGAATRRHHATARLVARVVQLAAAVGASGRTWPAQPGSCCGVGESA
jgi:hypothetical protein